MPANHGDAIVERRIDDVRQERQYLPGELAGYFFEGIGGVPARGWIGRPQGCDQIWQEGGVFRDDPGDFVGKTVGAQIPFGKDASEIIHCHIHYGYCTQTKDSPKTGRRAAPVSLFSGFSWIFRDLLIIMLLFR